MSEKFIEVKNQNELLEVVRKVENCGYNRITSNDYLSFDFFKKCYHGNSKILIKLYFNDILNRKEWKITTKATENSYKIK